MLAADYFCKCVTFGILGILEKYINVRGCGSCCSPDAGCQLLAAGCWLLAACWRYPDEEDQTCPKELNAPN